MSKTLDTIAAQDLSKRDGIIAAGDMIRKELHRIKVNAERNTASLVPYAAKVVLAAHKAGMFATDGTGVSKPDGDKALSLRAYATTIGYSHTMVGRLLRIGRAQEAGLVEAGTPRMAALVSNGSAKEYAVLDGDLSTVKPEDVDKAAAQVKENSAKERKAAAAKAKADKEAEAKAAEDAKALANLSDFEEMVMHVTAIDALVSSLSPEEAEIVHGRLTATLSAVSAAWQGAKPATRSGRRAS